MYKPFTQTWRDLEASASIFSKADAVVLQAATFLTVLTEAMGLAMTVLFSSDHVLVDWAVAFFMTFLLMAEEASLPVADQLVVVVGGGGRLFLFPAGSVLSKEVSILALRWNLCWRRRRWTSRICFDLKCREG
jgi:hypothetical protein